MTAIWGTFCRNLFCFVFFLERQEFVQFALKIAQAFFHFINTLYGVFYLPVQKALAGFIKNGVKRNFGTKRGFFSGCCVTRMIHVFSLIVKDDFNSGLTRQIV